VVFTFFGDRWFSPGDKILFSPFFRVGKFFWAVPVSLFPQLPFFSDAPFPFFSSMASSTPAIPPGTRVERLLPEDFSHLKTGLSFLKRWGCGFRLLSVTLVFSPPSHFHFCLNPPPSYVTNLHPFPGLVWDLLMLFISSSLQDSSAPLRKVKPPPLFL